MVSLFELFKVGIGPSSSHTVGPMRAAAQFVQRLGERPGNNEPARVEVVLYGSLAWTGRGHGTAEAVLLGLCGEHPESVDPDAVHGLVAEIRERKRLTLPGGATIDFDEERDLLFDFVTEAPVHPNTLSFAAFDAAGAPVAAERWCSIGGGFVVPEADVGLPSEDAASVPFGFASGRILLDVGRRTGLSIAEIVRANEHALRDPEAVFPPIWPVSWMS